MNRAFVGSPFTTFFAWAACAGIGIGSSGCGGGDASVKEDPLVIEAHIEGTVIDGVTHTPIAGASVVVPGIDGAAGTATTDENGFYSLEVPGVGSHTLFVEADDYARAKYTVTATTEPGASGTIRVTSVRNSQLYPTNGTLNGRVTSGGSRDIIVGAKVLVQFGDGVDPIEDASLKVTATTDKSGSFSIGDLPGGAPGTRVTIFPVDLDKDGVPDTAAFSSAVAGGPSSGLLTPDGQNFMDISVDQFIGDKVIWTNLDDASTIASDSPMIIQYATPMVIDDADAVTVTLRDGAQEIGADPAWESPVDLTITPKEPLVAGRPYTLSVVALSQAGTTVTFTKAFQVTSPDAPEDVVTGIEIVDALPLDWKAKTFTLAFDAVANAEGYRIFAHNDTNQTSWVMLYEGRVSQFGRPQVAVTLPDSFDTYPSDDVFSATGFGTTVEFSVQPFSGKNDGPMADEPVGLVDDHCPNLTITPPTTTNNTAGTDVLKVKYLLGTADNEPLADDPALTFKFETATTSTDMITINPKSMLIRRLRASQFEVSFEVPAAGSGVGDTVTVNLAKVTDTSGNAPDGTTTCPKTFTILSSL